MQVIWQAPHFEQFPLLCAASPFSRWIGALVDSQCGRLIAILPSTAASADNSSGSLRTVALRYFLLARIAIIVSVIFHALVLGVFHLPLHHPALRRRSRQAIAGSVMKSASIFQRINIRVESTALSSPVSVNKRHAFERKKKITTIQKKLNLPLEHGTLDIGSRRGPVCCIGSRGPKWGRHSGIVQKWL